ncbi:MAG: PadR family transcriptional regulator [Chloroflexota bacterium]
MTNRIKPDVDELLKTWEENYKKGLLTFWLLLFLHERPAYAYEAGAAIEALSQGKILADENSIYRALNRFETLGIVQSELQASKVGPPRRYYTLTKAGVRLLAKFIQRNILIFEDASIVERIQAVIKDAAELP